MLNKLINYFKNLQSIQRINLGLGRAAATSQLRCIQHSYPQTWEFCGFSQNGEDGVIDLLCSKLTHSNRYFVEIGAADGIENNTAFLAIAKKYSGMMIEGDKKLSQNLSKIVNRYSLGVECLNLFVNQANIPLLLKSLPFLNPDVFSLDIDGNDYYILKALFENDFRPKIIVVEYNSAFGPVEALTIPYQEDFDYINAHPSRLYYGVSIAAWRILLEKWGYFFVTTESNGVNAFFIDPQYFGVDFIHTIEPKNYVENFYQYKVHQGGWQTQWEQIRQMKFEEVK